MGSQAKQVNIEQGTPKWHTWRRTGVGNSDASALFFDENGKSVSPYKTARDLWFEKSGFGDCEDEDKTWLFRKGHQVEAELRQLFSKHIDIEIQPACFENGIFRGSLDGYDKSAGTFEAKFVGKEVLKKIASGEIPRHHEIQIQSQLHTSDSDHGFYGAKNGKSRIVVPFGRNEKLIKQVIQKGEAFWEAVLSGKVPELSAEDTAFIIDPEQIALVNRLAALKKKKDAIEAEYDEIDSMVKAMAKHSKVRCGDVLISEITKTGGIDYASVPEVKELSDEYLEMFRKKASTYKSIRFGKVT